MMAKTMHLIVTSVILGFLLQDAYSVTVAGGGEQFDTLLARIESLEATDTVNKARIESLEASDAVNKARIESLEASDAVNKARIESLEASDTVNKARIESLEASDVANKAKITEMESEFKVQLTLHERERSGFKLKMDEMESTFKLKESAMLDEIKKLTMTLTESNDASAEDQLGANDDADRTLSGPNRIQRRGNNFRQYREAPEIEVAFYATHQTHDIHHLGGNQILQFPVDVTNIGHAYNNNTGGFTAPVDGTYVIHATIMGLDTPNSHMKAHFDVNGTQYSKFYVTPYDQSSQMLVINLKAGQTVSVRNDYTDAGFVGQHFTTFSGFLLYQHYPSGPVVGK